MQYDPNAPPPPRPRATPPAGYFDFPQPPQYATSGQGFGGGAPTGGTTPPQSNTYANQNYGYANTQGFGPGNNLIGQTITPQWGQGTQQAQTWANQAGQNYAGYQRPDWQGLSSNTSQSQGVYDKLIQQLQGVVGTGPMVAGGGGFSNPLATMAGTTVKEQLDKVLHGPDRTQLASDAYNLMAEQGQPQFMRDQQDVGRKAAAWGSIGAGRTTSELGDVQMNREKLLSQARQGLATESAGQTLQDRLSQLQAAQGVFGQSLGGSYGGGDMAGGGYNARQMQAMNMLAGLAGDLGGREQQQYQNRTGERAGLQDYAQQGFANQRGQFGDFTGYQNQMENRDLGLADWLRGERGYQGGLEQQGVNNAVNQYGLQQGGQQQAFNQWLQQQQMLAGLGFGTNPTGAYQNAAGYYGGQGQQATQGAGDWLQQWLLSQQMKNMYQPSGGTRPPAASMPQPQYPGWSP